MAAFWRRAVRDGAWLTAERVRVIGWFVLVDLAALTAAAVWLKPELRFGYDFGAFWTAGRLALAGQATEAYAAGGRAAMAALFGAGPVQPPFFYPPIALLLWAPFGMLPFPVALGAWLALSGAAYLAAMRGLLGGRLVVLAAGFPAVFTCVLLGQNALWTGALFGGIALWLDRRPAVAGVLVGLLAYKPQFGVLVPVLLAVSGRWRAFAVAGLTVAGLGGLSAGLFGWESWGGFGAALGAAQAWYTDGRTAFAMFAGVYPGMRLLEAPAAVARVAQGVAAIVAVLLLVVVARRRPGGGAEVAALVTASGFCVPFLGDYDLVIFAVAGAWIGGEAGRTGWLAYEKAALGLLFMAPLAIKSAAGTFGVPLAPLALMLLFALVWRRAMRPAGDAREPPG